MDEDKYIELPKGYWIFTHEYIREPNICVGCTDYSKLGQSIEFTHLALGDKRYKWKSGTNIPSRITDGSIVFAMEFEFVEDLEVKRAEEKQNNLWDKIGAQLRDSDLYIYDLEVIKKKYHIILKHDPEN